AERAQARHHRAVAARIAARRRSRPSARSGHADLLDEHELRQPLTRTDRYSWSDTTAAPIVAAGGGIEALLEATDLRSRENLLGLIDPALLVRALDTDAKAEAAAQPDRTRLRRLSPDPELVRRRAAGETLRALAADYQVAHTTLGRWFKRPQVASQLRAAKRHPPAPTTSQHRPRPPASN
ncbi:MAG: hypothetical protein M3Q31_19830, partial [Actinomycetota bacterium]|nr:hypothetical protein [Actinomycetota bacterium]